MQRHGLWLFARLLAVAVVLRLAATLIGGDAQSFSYWTIAGHIDQFLIGMLAGQFFAARPENRLSLGYQFPLAGGLVVAVLYGFNQLGGWPVHVWWKALWPTAEGAMWAYFILCYIGAARWLPSPVSRVFEGIGQTSYSIYLLHFIVLEVLRSRGWILTPLADPLLDALITTLIVVLPVTLLLAVLTFTNDRGAIPIVAHTLRSRRPCAQLTRAKRTFRTASPAAASTTLPPWTGRIHVRMLIRANFSQLRNVPPANIIWPFRMRNKRIRLGGPKMRLGVKLIAASALATAISASDSGRAFADCATRHFYNHSNMPWTIVMGKDAGACSYGNSGNVLTCTIPPLQTGEIHYASTFFSQALNAVTKGLAAVNGGPSVQNVPAGNVMIVSGDNGKIYPAHYFEIENGPTKCYLKHNGNTGNVVLNDPADGDIATCGRGPGGNYDCR